ncbi:hypothetical protein D9M72_554700 [compost metagenome]
MIADEVDVPIANVDRDVEFWVSTGEFWHRRGKALIAERRYARDAELTAWSCVAVSDRAPHVIEFLQKPRTLLYEFHSRIGQTELPGRPVKKPDAEVSLQVSDYPAH